MKLPLPGSNCTEHFESHSIHLSCTEYKIHLVNKNNPQFSAADTSWHRRDTGELK